MLGTRENALLSDLVCHEVEKLLEILLEIVSVSKSYRDWSLPLIHLKDILTFIIGFETFCEFFEV